MVKIYVSIERATRFFFVCLSKTTISCYTHIEIVDEIGHKKKTELLFNNDSFNPCRKRSLTNVKTKKYTAQSSDRKVMAQYRSHRLIRGPAFA